MTAEIVGHCKSCGVAITTTTRAFVYPDRSIECEPCHYEGPPAESVSVVTSKS